LGKKYVGEKVDRGNADSSGKHNPTRRGNRGVIVTHPPKRKYPLKTQLMSREKSPPSQGGLSDAEPRGKAEALVVVPETSLVGRWEWGKGKGRESGG